MRDIHWPTPRGADGNQLAAPTREPSGFPWRWLGILHSQYAPGKNSTHRRPAPMHPARQSTGRWIRVSSATSGDRCARRCYLHRKRESLDTTWTAALTCFRQRWRDCPRDKRSRGGPADSIPAGETRSQYPNSIRKAASSPTSHVNDQPPVLREIGIVVQTCNLERSHLENRAWRQFFAWHILVKRRFADFEALQFCHTHILHS